MKTENEQLATAIRIAAQAHENQVDKAGNPYILHPLQVMNDVRNSGPLVMAIAVLHDVIEDTKVTYLDLENSGFSARVIEGVRAMTKQRGQSYDEYKHQVKQNLDAIIVKMADLRHNSDLRRLIDVTEKDFERAHKYMKFYRELEDFVL